MENRKEQWKEFLICWKLYLGNEQKEGVHDGENFNYR